MTERLRLVAQRLDRFEQWLNFSRARDEPGHRDLSDDDAWLRLCARQGMWAAFGWGFYFILDPQTEAMIGEVGLQFRRRGLGARFDASPEAAWVLGAPYQNRGLALEAMTAVFDAYDRRIIRDGLTGTDPVPGTTVALIAADNALSLRLAGKLGFVTYADAEYLGRDFRLLERPRTPPNPN